MKVKFNGLELTQGCFVSGSIKGKKMEGRIYIKNKNDLYFCQDKEYGTVSPELYHYKYSWVFYSYDTSSDVKILKILKTPKRRSTIKTFKGIVNNKVINKNGGYKQVEKETSIQYFNIKHGSFPKKVVNTVKLFKMKNHPDCCGSILLYDFDSSNNDGYSLYKDLKPKDYKNIKELLANIQAAKLVHLSHKQTVAIKFVEKLGFKKQYEYVNNNTCNTILVYHQNPKKK